MAYDDGKLIPKHGGFRGLKTFQLAEVIYDVTVLFCGKFIDARSRTHDQMTQAARSGRQNIAEGSMDSATSKKIELKLTGVARGSLEELRLDYEDFLRQRGLPQWPTEHPALGRFRALRCASLAEFRGWVSDEVQRAKREAEGATGDNHGHNDQDKHRQTRKRPEVSGGPCESVPVRVSLEDLPAVLAANGALSLLNLCIHLLCRQMDSLAKAFEEEGGFTERLYRMRNNKRKENP